MFLIYSDATSKTGKELAQCLGIACGSRPPNKTEDLLIRWGSTEQVVNRPKKVLNNRKAILLTTDKIKSCAVLRANGVPTPEVVDADLALELNGMIKFPTLGRRRHHSQGQDIILCLQARDIKLAVNDGSEYFSEYIRTAREYRVHVLNNKVIRVNQKLLGDRDRYTPYIRNVDNGYVFGTPKIALTLQQEQHSIEAVKALGLDFGAVDLIISDDNKTYILEVNTGPSLCEAGLAIYTTELKNLITMYA